MFTPLNICLYAPLKLQIPRNNTLHGTIVSEARDFIVSVVGYGTHVNPL